MASIAIPATRVRVSSRATVGLFGATTFTASMLVFLVQPMFAKMVLPKLGGSSAVWNTCVVFFQTSLLLGYLYAHVTTRWLGVRRQAIAHLILMTGALAFLPLSLGDDHPPATSDPVWWLLATMTVRLGLPFLAVSTMAPLIQRWFATMPLPSASNPYFLYAASNVGSLLALLAYPFVLEPFWGTQLQSELWRAGYVVLLVLVAACAVGVTRKGREMAPAASGASRVSWRERGRWTWLACIPSSLMLGVTTHISTDLAAIPLLWILPLAAYLLTFIIAFSTRTWISDRLLARAMPVLALAVIVSLTWHLQGPWLVPLHLVTFFAAALCCHTALVRARPGPEDLTEFYVWMSFGGMLGGAFNSLVAPHLFNGIAEYPIAVALACLVRSSPHYRKGQVEPWPLFTVGAIVPLAMFTGLWSAGKFAPEAGFPLALIMASTIPAACFVIANRTAPFNAIMVLAAVLLALVGSSRSAVGGVIFAGRSFFGVSRVVEAHDASYHLLQHGSTLHGRQNLPAGSLCEPRSYYDAAGPIGQVFRMPGVRFASVAVVGLGSGGLSCYAEPGSSWTYFEIDPLVERIARDPRLFTFLQNSRVQPRVAIGDGRKKVEESAAASFDMIVIDAFSSDSVPVHLLTREALGVYRSRLKPSGLIALHISNRYVQLEPVVAATVATTDLFALAKLDNQIPPADAGRGRSPTHWVVLARAREALGPLNQDLGWRPLEGRAGIRAWTDDYSNLLNSIQWW